MTDDFMIVASKIFLMCLFIGALIIGLIWFLGPLANQTTNQLFNSSQQHTQAVAQKFSDDCLQLAETTDQTAKKAIENDIYQEASTIDLSQINMTTTTRACVHRAIEDVSHEK